MVSLSSPGTGRARAVLAGHIIILLLPFPFVALRFWSRWKLRARVALNDYLIAAALVVTTGLNIIFVLVTIYGGYGQHIWNVTPTELVFYQKASLAGTVTWPTANTVVKLSILHFYSAIFFVNKKTVLASYLLAGLTICYWLATCITAFTICTPFAYTWNKVTIQGSCGDELKYFLSTAIVNLLIDVMIVVLPLPSVWALQMVTSRKIALTFIFGLGAGICAISIVRTDSIAFIDPSDNTYNEVLNGITACLEPSLGIVNACLPIMQPVASTVYTSKAFSSLRNLLSRTSLDREGSAAKHEAHNEFSNWKLNGQNNDRHRHTDDVTASLRRDNENGEEYGMTELSTEAPGKAPLAHPTV